MALSGSLMAPPLGGGSRVTMASSTSGMPIPVLAEIITASEASSPMTSSICSLIRSGSAAGRSILLSTGTISWSASMACIDIGQRLRFDALAGVDHQQRALAGPSERDTS
jgi:hypothetical protein